MVRRKQTALTMSAVEVPAAAIVIPRSLKIDNMKNFFPGNRGFVYRRIIVGSPYMDDLYSLTVVQLKERLKENGLPVSGKKADLIARLKGSGEASFIPGETLSDLEFRKPSIKENYEIECSACPTILRVPCDYSGNITCPQCNAKSEVTARWEDGGANLSGVVNNPPVSSTPLQNSNDYDFVTGPDGQLVAIKKSGFRWVDWAMGFLGTIAGYVFFWTVGIDGSTEMCLLCFFTLPPIVGGIGTASGKPGVLVGAMTAMAAIPIMLVVGCFVMIATW